MIHALAHVRRLTRLRFSALGVLAAVAAASACDNTDPLANSEPTDVPAPVAATDAAAPVESIETALASTNGVPFGAFGLWSSSGNTLWGPKPLTNAQNCVAPSYIVRLISAARSQGQSLLLQMTCADPSEFKSGGKFDLNKWKSRMNQFNTSTIRNAIAAGVSDGTVIGNSMFDEPERSASWGTMTKAVIDNAAAYGKSLFPTLPMGVSHGGGGLDWQSSTRYYKLDYVNYQYSTRLGSVSSFRDKALARGQRDGTATSFSLNVLNGGRQDTDGSWTCSGAGQAGVGTRKPNCRMTADQLRDYGRTLGPSACQLVMWRFDSKWFSRSDNQQAMRDVASTLASKSRRPCK